MREQFIRNMHDEMLIHFNEQQWSYIHSGLNKHLPELFSSEEAPATNKDENIEYLQLYIAAKRLEGCSPKTLAYYKSTLLQLINSIECSVKNISSEELRLYLQNYQDTHSIGKVSADNMRRIISAFFSWMEIEDYILKSPARKLRKVKPDKTIKIPFTDEEMERIFNQCSNTRDKAMIYFLACTGVRVGELTGIKRSMVDFTAQSCIVFGKGNKEREVYFDARTKLCLQEYLKNRTDKNDALFVSLKAPYEAISIGGVEKMLKRLENASGVKNVHPHRFRRYVATKALRKGMPIEQVQHMLGHTRIETTLHYVTVDQENVKLSHKKYLQ